MEHRYIAVLGDVAEPSADALDDAGMQNLMSTGGVRVYSEPGAPTRILSKNAVLIGHLFPKHAQAPGCVASGGPSSPVMRDLLDNFWGDYVVIEAGDDAIGSVRILRSPSGGVACVHSINNGRGFATSDISIPVGLGLCERRVDWNYIVHALNFTLLRSARTGIAGVSELLPGCLMTVGESTTDIHTAWSPWSYVSEGLRFKNPAEAARSIRHAVSASVTAWADRDRDLLLELSGGLDSSIVGACLSRTDARVTCCTLTSPFSGTDERQYARQISDLLGARLNMLTVDADSARFDFPPPPDSVVPGMGISHYGADASLHRAASDHSTTSFISGAGGDTVFCYLGNASPAADAFRECGLRAGFRAIADLSTLYNCPLPKAARLALRKMLRGPKPTRPFNHTFLAPAARLLQPDPHPWLDAPPDAFIGDQERIGALVGTQGYFDGIARNRRWPMRFPLLAQPVVETCLRVPAWMWIRTGRNRAIARDAFADLLPADILHRTSKGTYVTLAGALYARNRTKMLRFLEDGHLNARKLLDMPALRTTLASVAPPRDISFFRIFDLCMIENWISHQGSDTPRVAVPPPFRSGSFIDRQTLY